ncbi:MAG: GTPase ObgE, partial [Bacteroidaceae bacterium]|nr:GTPase ObgE [Bacteroidaceae bacterium]
KSDILEDELIEILSENLPEGSPHVFIYSVTGLGVQELKDILWQELNSEDNRMLAVKREELVHRNYDAGMLARDFADWQPDFEDEFPADDEEYYEEENYDEYDFDE